MAISFAMLSEAKHLFIEKRIPARLNRYLIWSGRLHYVQDDKKALPSRKI